MSTIKYTKQMLSDMGLYELRQVAWKLGIHLPTVYKKHDLIEKVLEQQENPEASLIASVKQGRPQKKFFVDESSWFNDDFGKKTTNSQILSSWEKGDWITQPVDFFESSNVAVRQSDNENLQLKSFKGVFMLEKNGCGTIHFGELQEILASQTLLVSPDRVTSFFTKSGNTVIGDYYVDDEGKKHLRDLDTAKDIYDSFGVFKNFSELNIKNVCEVIPLWNNQNLMFTKYLSPIGKGQRAVVCGPKKSGKTFLLTNMAEEFANQGVHTIYLSLDKRPENHIEFKNSAIENVFVPFDVRPFRQVYVLQLVFERAQRFCEAGKDVVVFVDDLMSAVSCYDNYIATREENYDGITTMQEIKRLMALARNTSDGGSLTIVGCLNTQKENADKWLSVFEEICNCRIYLDKNLQLISKTNVLPVSSTDSCFENLPQEFVEKGNKIRIECFDKSIQEIASIYQEKIK